MQTFKILQLSLMNIQFLSYYSYNPERKKNHRFTESLSGVNNLNQNNMTKFQTVKFGAIICRMYCTVVTLILSIFIIVVFWYLCKRPSITCSVDVCSVIRSYWNVTWKHHPPLPKNIMFSDCRHWCYLILKIYIYSNISQNNH